MCHSGLTFWSGSLRPPRHATLSLSWTGAWSYATCPGMNAMEHRMHRPAITRRASRSSPDGRDEHWERSSPEHPQATDHQLRSQCGQRTMTKTAHKRCSQTVASKSRWKQRERALRSKKLRSGNWTSDMQTLGRDRPTGVRIVHYVQMIDTAKPFLFCTFPRCFVTPMYSTYGSWPVWIIKMSDNQGSNRWGSTVQGRWIYWDVQILHQRWQMTKARKKLVLWGWNVFKLLLTQRIISEMGMCN